MFYRQAILCCVRPCIQDFADNVKYPLLAQSLSSMIRAYEFGKPGLETASEVSRHNSRPGCSRSLRKLAEENVRVLATSAKFLDVKPRRQAQQNCWTKAVSTLWADEYLPPVSINGAKVPGYGMYIGTSMMCSNSDFWTSCKGWRRGMYTSRNLGFGSL